MAIRVLRPLPDTLLVLSSDADVLNRLAAIATALAVDADRQRQLAADADAAADAGEAADAPGRGSVAQAATWATAPRCGGLTSRGTPCQRRPAHGATHCDLHPPLPEPEAPPEPAPEPALALPAVAAVLEPVVAACGQCGAGVGNRWVVDGVARCRLCSREWPASAGAMAA